MTVHHLTDTSPVNPTTALLIVDVQQGFINHHTCHIPDVVERLQEHYEHVFASRFINASDSPHRRFIDWHKFDAESSEVELAFTPKANAVVFDKKVYTCVNKELLAVLEERHINEVHLCGIDTDVCVMLTAVDLFKNKIRPVVLSEASASHGGQEYHDNALSILRRQIGHNQVL